MRFDGDLLFTALAESFLSEDELFRLRAVLYPSDLLNLRNLSQAETTTFFRNVSNRKRLGWTEKFIQMLAASSEGYPLLMQERLQREIGLPLRSMNTPNHRNLKY
jgi:hypothetical protein